MNVKNMSRGKLFSSSPCVSTPQHRGTSDHSSSPQGRAMEDILLLSAPQGTGRKLSCLHRDAFQ